MPPSRFRAISELLAAPDEREQADPAAGRQLGRARPSRDARRRRRYLDGRRHRAQEVRERPVVEEPQDAVPYLGAACSRAPASHCVDSSATARWILSPCIANATRSPTERGNRNGYDSMRPLVSALAADGEAPSSRPRPGPSRGPPRAPSCRPGTPAPGTGGRRTFSQYSPYGSDRTRPPSAVARPRAGGRRGRAAATPRGQAGDAAADDDHVVPLDLGFVVHHASTSRATIVRCRQRADATACATTASNIATVSRPVNVFCWLGWYEPRSAYGPTRLRAVPEPRLRPRTDDPAPSAPAAPHPSRTRRAPGPPGPRCSSASSRARNGAQASRSSIVGLLAGGAHRTAAAM